MKRKHYFPNYNISLCFKFLEATTKKKKKTSKKKLKCIFLYYLQVEIIYIIKNVIFWQFLIIYSELFIRKINEFKI